MFRDRPAFRLSLAAAVGLALASIAIAPGSALAQSSGGSPVVIDPAAGAMPELGPDIEPGQAAVRAPGGRSVTPLLAPVPFKNTQLGWGLMLMGGLIHRFDTSTAVKPSTGVVGGFYTENGSWGVIFMENAKLAGDAWRVRLMAGHPEVRYNFYGIGEAAGEAGRSVEVQQNMNMAQVAILRRIRNSVYLGATAVYLGSSIALRDTTGLGLPPSAGDTAHMEVFAPGLQAEVDTRNDDYWPTHGTLVRAKAWFFVHALGGDREFQRYLFNGSWYAPVRERLTVAANLNTCGASGDAPFWALCSVGFGRGGLRGYTQGRYRDTVMTTEQVELRYHTAGRFGATAFAGMGHVASTFSDIFNAKVLPAGGVGLRYQLTQKFPMHMRLDFSWGRDGPVYYFGVSEAY